MSGVRTPAVATFVSLSVLMGCSSDGEGGDDFDATVDTNLDQVEIDQVATIIRDDDVLGPLVGPTPVMTDTAPWTGTRPYRPIGAVTTVAVLDGPHDVQVDLPTWECLDGHLWGVRLPDRGPARPELHGLGGPQQR